MSTSTNTFDSKLEIAPGIWKRVGDCTAADWDGAIELLEKRRRLQIARQIIIDAGFEPADEPEDDPADRENR